MIKLEENREVLEAFRLGEMKAMEDVYLSYAQQVASFLYNGFGFSGQGKNHRFYGVKGFELESLVQEVFVRAFNRQSRESYDGIRPYLNYLLAIARNLVIDSYRKKKNLEILTDQVDLEDNPNQLDDDLLSMGSDPESQVSQKQLANDLHAFIKNLNPDEYQLFEIRFIQGNSLRNSFRLLDWSEHRIRKTERKLKKRFFIYMHDKGYFDGYRWGHSGLEQLMLTFCMWA
jgi:RNA polymerase sigma-70 factor (ECF subfamily)